VRRHDTARPNGRSCAARKVTASDEKGGDKQRAPVGGLDGIDELIGIDVAQDAIQHHDCDRDDGETQRHTEPAQPDLGVEKARGPTQASQHAALRIGSLRIHRQFRFVSYGVIRKLPAMNFMNRSLSWPVCGNS
jgi:hypothetical protein